MRTRKPRFGYISNINIHRINFHFSLSAWCLCSLGSLFVEVSLDVSVPFLEARVIGLGIQLCCKTFLTVTYIISFAFLFTFILIMETVTLLFLCSETEQNMIKHTIVLEFSHDESFLLFLFYPIPLIHFFLLLLMSELNELIFVRKCHYNFQLFLSSMYSKILEVDICCV